MPDFINLLIAKQRASSDATDGHIIHAPLSENQLLDIEYNETHCPHCGRVYETKWQVCPDDICNEVYNQ